MCGVCDMQHAKVKKHGATENAMKSEVSASVATMNDKTVT